MWDDGVFLGVKGSTGELIVGNEKGVWRTRTVRRKPEGERWESGFDWRSAVEDEQGWRRRRGRIEK
jgi:hypothetical protein